MTTVRMLPVNGNATGWAGSPSNVAARRSYTATPGQTIDATDEEDASTLTSQGFIVIGGSGTTAARPTTTGLIKPGYFYVDTTLNLVIVWDGANWRNPVTGAAV